MARRIERHGAIRWVCVLALLLVVAVVRPAAREYRTIEHESLKITIDSDWASRSAPGYLPLRFDITNAGEARVIQIIAQGSRFFRPPPRTGTGTMYITQSVRLGRGDRVRLTMPIPVFADSENIGFEIREDGRVLERFNYTSTQSRLASGDASVLLVATSGSPFGQIAQRLQRVTGGRRVGGVVVPTPSGSPDFTLEPDRLPANWLGFTSLRAVVIGRTEWDQLSDGQKNAVLTWTACGGDLIVVDGDLGALLPSAHSELTTSSDPLLNHPVARHFLGRVHMMTSEMLTAAGLSSVVSSTENGRDFFWAMPANTAPDFGVIEARGFRLRIPGINGVPARVYLLILVLFSLLIGPANYWLLWRKRRLVLLVLTAPAISAVFIVLLAGYAVAGEGFRVQGRAVTFTVLDQVTKQAATRATVSMYAAGLTPSGGLRFPRDVAVFPIGSDGTGIRDRLSMDLSEAQLFTGGVFQARSPTNLEQVAFRPARERLTFSHESGGVTVTNGLEAGVSVLLYKDGDTLYRLNGPLPSGGKQVLNGAPIDPGALLPATVSIPSKFLDLIQNQPRGSYLAVLDRSPFWDTGVPSVIEHGSVHVVLGWPEGQR